jgi:undecaprenyl-diphosphatase
MDSLGFGSAFLIGCAQVLALVPGISRSGVSISAGLAVGLTRESAARFSFLMATPIIAAAGFYETVKLVTGDVDVALDAGVLLAGFGAAAVSGLAAIGLLLRYLRSHTMTVFVVYRLVLAAIIGGVVVLNAA